MEPHFCSIRQIQCNMIWKSFYIFSFGIGRKSQFHTFHHPSAGQKCTLLYESERRIFIKDSQSTNKVNWEGCLLGNPSEGKEWQAGAGLGRRSIGLEKPFLYSDPNMGSVFCVTTSHKRWRKSLGQNNTYPDKEHTGTIVCVIARAVCYNNIHQLLILWHAICTY